MFNFSWSEIGVIVAVALVLIGPKDMPVAVRAVMGTIRKARRMAGEFQGHVDEMMREANLGDVRETLNEFRNLNVADALERSIDPDGTLRDGFDDAPLAGDGAESIGELGAEAFDRPEEADPIEAGPPPAFIPPIPEPPRAAATDIAFPDFIPPGARAPR